MRRRPWRRRRGPSEEQAPPEMAAPEPGPGAAAGTPDYLRAETGASPAEAAAAPGPETEEAEAEGGAPGIGRKAPLPDADADSEGADSASEAGWEELGRARALRREAAAALAADDADAGPAAADPDPRIAAARAALGRAETLAQEGGTAADELLEAVAAECGALDELEAQAP
ncbi:hypothetical protein [Mangrovicoccus sp. HB161399]|uniref:hypothetical protein n=1 Tax=Mangrovicoccus sp. HB161399 TaxID=2720392 RepID=UPI001554F40A|nr:hypothetical protein [Mangrovicoccus sp. HB161399]